MEHFEVNYKNAFIIVQAAVISSLMYMILHNGYFIAFVALLIWATIFILEPKINKRRYKK